MEAMLHDEAENKGPATASDQLGQPLERLSVDELKAYINRLEREIERARETIAAKQNHANSAEALFKAFK
jgi:uncharacterized small protein (DUF1192 family)